MTFSRRRRWPDAACGSGRLFWLTYRHLTRVGQSERALRLRGAVCAVSDLAMTHQQEPDPLPPPRGSWARNLQPCMAVCTS